MKSNEMYTIQYDANYFWVLRFVMHDRGTGMATMGIILQGLSKRAILRKGSQGRHSNEEISLIRP